MCRWVSSYVFVGLDLSSMANKWQTDRLILTYTFSQFTGSYASARTLALVRTFRLLYARTRSNSYISTHTYIGLYTDTCTLNSFTLYTCMCFTYIGLNAGSCTRALIKTHMRFGSMRTGTPHSHVYLRTYTLLARAHTHAHSHLIVVIIIAVIN